MVGFLQRLGVVEGKESRILRDFESNGFKRSIKRKERPSSHYLQLLNLLTAVYSRQVHTLAESCHVGLIISMAGTWFQERGNGTDTSNIRHFMTASNIYRLLLSTWDSSVVKKYNLTV